MPQIVKKFKILIASPSDVMDERGAIAEVIGELNNTYGNRSGVIIELIKWETHATPGITMSQSTQDIVDEGLGSDYDLFVGVLWMKFGTETARYGSGTEQEFRNVHERFLKNPESVQVLFYFKQAPPLSLGDLDTEQLTKINAFKSDIGKLGVFYWQYNTILEFQQFLRFHIPRRIDELNKLSEMAAANTVAVSSQILTILESKIESDDDDLGIMDLNDIIEDSFNYSSESLNRITDATEWIGKEMTKKADEMNRLTARGDVAKKTLKDWFERAAEIMNDFASRIEPEVPVFHSNFEKGVDAISKLLALYDDGDGMFNDQKDEVTQSIVGLLDGMESGIEGMESLLLIISKLPRMQKELNKARRTVEVSLFEVINSLKISKDLAMEILKDLPG